MFLFMRNVRSLSHTAPQRSFHQRLRCALAIRVVGGVTTSSWSSIGYIVSTWKLSNHCRSDPVQVQSTLNRASGLRSTPKLASINVVSTTMLRLSGHETGISAGTRTQGHEVRTGAWCSGITSASHAEGPGFKSQCVHCFMIAH
jgi:hypothetical protein